jgi:hypothetical protein
MENLQPIFEKKETFIGEWQDCYISDSKITGFVCTFHLKNKQHIFYGLNDIQALLKEAKKRKHDIYLSLNAFEYGVRQTGSLKQIRNIGVDIDCYKLNIPVDRALEEIKRLIFKGSIPNPNVIIFSGRGLQLLYSISGGAAPKMSFLTQYITAQFISDLRHLGADTSGTDVTRVFRLPYSVNSRNGKQVTFEIWRTLEYSLQELYAFCKPLEKRRKAPRSRKATLHTLPAQKDLRNLYSLNTARKNDLEALVSLRMGEIEKRNVLTYVYAYTVALILKNKEATLEFADQLNMRLTDPQKNKELRRTAGNAYDDAMKFFDEFQKRDFKMWYQQMDGIKRPMKNVTIIEELDITAEEMKHLTTIIDGLEKQARDTFRKRTKRRDEGVKKREDYLKEQHNTTNSKLTLLQELLQKEPNSTNKSLAEAMNVSVRYIQKLKKQLQG